MKCFLGIIYLILSITLVGCSAVSIESAIVSDIRIHPSKIFIYITGGFVQYDFFNDLSDNLQKELSKHNIDSDYYVAHSLALKTESEINELILTYNPDLVMNIHQIGITQDMQT